MTGTDTLLDQVVEVCPLPATTQRVMALTASDAASIPEVARVLATDPALAAAVLSVANSAAYALQKVDRLEAAVMRLGLKELHNLAAAMALFAAFRNRGELTLQLHEACVASGSLAHGLAKSTGLAHPGTAFVCGLLSEIGAMACLVFDGKDYAALWQHSATSVDTRIELETLRYGASSFAIGQRFLERNSLPETICAAVGAELTREPEKLEPLSRITLLARHAPPIVKQHAGDADSLAAALDVLARRVNLEKIDGARLARACAEARAGAQPI